MSDFVIIGVGEPAKMALHKMIAQGHDCILVTPEEYKELPTTTITSILCEHVNKADKIMLINEVKHEKCFEPKKLHPKHQKQNKFRNAKQ